MRSSSSTSSVEVMIACQSSASNQLMDNSCLGELLGWGNVGEGQIPILVSEPKGLIDDSMNAGPIWHFPAFRFLFGRHDLYLALWLQHLGISRPISIGLKWRNGFLMVGCNSWYTLIIGQMLFLGTFSFNMWAYHGIHPLWLFEENPRTETVTIGDDKWYPDY